MRAGVGLDADALANAGDLAAKLRVEDLRQSGWDVVGPREEDDGLTWVRATKPFSSPEQGDRVLAELSGPRGPLRDLDLSQRQSFFRTGTGFSGVVDLSAGLTGLVDPDLEQRLGGSVGLDLEALRSRFGESLGDVFRIEVVARLPGSIHSNAEEEVNGGAKWVVAPGEQLRLEADAKAFNLLPWLPAIGALLAVALALAMVWSRRRR